MKNTPIEKLFQNEEREGLKNIKTTFKSLTKESADKSLKEIAEANTMALQTLVEKEQVKTPSKKETIEQQKRHKLKSMIEKQIKLFENPTIPVELMEQKQKLENYPLYKLKEKFSNIKNRETSILLTDQFNIYNVENIRKYYKEGKTMEDVFSKIERSKTMEFEIDKIISDYRTKPTGYENLEEYINIPKMKIGKKICLKK